MEIDAQHRDGSPFAGLPAARVREDGTVLLRARLPTIAGWVLMAFGGLQLLAALTRLPAGAGAASLVRLPVLLLLVAVGGGLLRTRVEVTDESAVVANMTRSRTVRRATVTGVDTASAGSPALRVRLHTSDGDAMAMTACSAMAGPGSRTRPGTGLRDIEAAFRSWADAPGPVPSGAAQQPPPPPGAMAERTEPVRPVAGIRRLGADRVRIRFGAPRLIAAVLVLVVVLPQALRSLSTPAPLWGLAGPVGIASPVLGVVVPLVALIAAVRLAVVRVELTAEELSAVNLRRRRRVPRHRVAEVTWSVPLANRGGGAVLRVVLDDDSSVGLLATYAMLRTVRGHQHPQAALEWALDRWRVTGELPDEHTAG